MTAATAVKERPILFSGAMVRAILAGKKSQTRRVMKPQPELSEATGFNWKGQLFGIEVDGSPYMRSLTACSPYGIPGDHLWVRETWAPFDFSYEDTKPSDLPHGAQIVYLANQKQKLAGDKYRPSIFLPRWASRITLEVTAVCVQRVQEISEEDARAEGCDTSEVFATTCKGAYAILWDAINGKRPGCAWSDNPWTWAITFRRIA